MSAYHGHYNVILDFPIQLHNLFYCVPAATNGSPKGLTAPLILLHMVLERSWLTLTQAVDVQDGHQFVELVVRSEGHGLPHGALGQLSITQQAEHPVAAERDGVPSR